MKNSLQWLCGSTLLRLSLFFWVLVFVTPGDSCALSPGKLTVMGESGEIRFEVEIADNNSDRAKGLMFRNSISQGTGMLFVYDPPRVVDMWMKNTLIPLDMIFIGAGGAITKIHNNAESMSEQRISSWDEVRAVLEIGGGEAERLGIKTGDKVEFLKLE